MLARGRQGRSQPAPAVFATGPAFPRQERRCHLLIDRIPGVLIGRPDRQE
jgi:hypothetical protein